MDNDSGVSASKKIRRDLSKEKEDLRNTSRDQLVEKILRQQQELDTLQSKQSSDSSLDELRESVERMKMQVAESNRQENMLMQRLGTKDREVQELLVQISDLKQAMNPSSAQLQSMLLDPAVNLLYVQMKREMDNSRTQLEQSQKDLAAWKFTPDSQTGKRLMAKCRMLLQENEELGRTVSSGRLAKLEGDIALQKRLISEMKNSEKDTEEFLGDVDDDLEAMQGTVYLLQQELKEAKERIAAQQLEIDQLKEVAAARTESDGPKSGGILPTAEAVNMLTSDNKTAVVDYRTRPEQSCGQVGIEEKRANKMTSSSKQRRQTVSKSDLGSSTSDSGKLTESMDVDSDDAGDMLRNNGRQNCLLASSRTSLVVTTGQETKTVRCASTPPSDESIAADEGLHRSAGGAENCRTGVVKLGVIDRDFAMQNGLDDDSRRATVTE